MDFADRLAELRRERQMTQVMLAERVGIHPSQLHRYEAGTAEPTLGVIRRLCVALSVSADELVLPGEKKAPAKDRLQAAVETAIDLSRHERDVVAELIEAFVAAHIAKEKSNLPRGPVQRRKRS